MPTRKGYTPKRASKGMHRGEELCTPAGIIVAGGKVSTKWEYRKCILESASPPPSASTDGAERAGVSSLPRRDRSKSIWLEIGSAGGAESWWVIKARGVIIKVPGWLAIEDVMTLVNGE